MAAKIFSGERAGRCTAERAKASLIDHCCDVVVFLLAAFVEMLPDLLSWMCLVFIMLTFPVSVPVIAFIWRRQERIEMRNWEAQQ